MTMLPETPTALPAGQGARSMGAPTTVLRNLTRDARAGTARVPPSMPARRSRRPSEGPPASTCGACATRVRPFSPVVEQARALYPSGSFSLWIIRMRGGALVFGSDHFFPAVPPQG